MQKNTVQLQCVFLLTVIHTPQPFWQLLAANLGCARFKSSSKLGFHSLAQGLSLS